MAYDQHIRTEKELEAQLSGLLEVKSIFDELGIKMFLTAGTLLGAVREKDFIKWDWNISVAFFDSELKNRLDYILQKLTEYNFEYKLTIKGDSKEFIGIKARKDGATYIIENLIKVGDYYLRPRHKIPSKLFKNYAPVELRNKEFDAPYPPEHYLAWYYGIDWRIPTRIDHRNDIISAESYR